MDTTMFFIEATFNYFARQILRDQGDGTIK